MSPEQMLLILLDMPRKALSCPALHIAIFLDCVGGSAKLISKQDRVRVLFLLIRRFT